MPNQNNNKSSAQKNKTPAQKATPVSQSNPKSSPNKK